MLNFSNSWGNMDQCNDIEHSLEWQIRRSKNKWVQSCQETCRKRGICNENYGKEALQLKSPMKFLIIFKETFFISKFDNELWKPETQKHLFFEPRKYIRSIVMRFFKGIGELNDIWNEMYPPEKYGTFATLDDVSILYLDQGSPWYLSFMMETLKNLYTFIFLDSYPSYNRRSYHWSFWHQTYIRISWWNSSKSLQNHCCYWNSNVFVGKRTIEYRPSNDWWATWNVHKEAICSFKNNELVEWQNLGRFSLLTLYCKRWLDLCFNHYSFYLWKFNINDLRFTFFSF